MKHDAKGSHLGNVLDYSTTDELNDEHDEDGNANSMVRVRKGSLGTYGEEGQYEGGRQEQEREDLKPGVISNRMDRLPRVEPNQHHREGDQEEENHGSQDAVGQDDGMVLVKRGEAIAHSIVSHGVKVGALQVGEEERVLGKVPRPIPHHHGVGIIAHGPGRGELVWCRRHDGDDGREALAMRSSRGRSMCDGV